MEEDGEIGNLLGYAYPDQLDAGIEALKLQSYLFYTGRSLFFRLLHHAVERLWVNEMLERNSL